MTRILQSHFLNVTPKLVALLAALGMLGTSACESVFDQPPPLMVEDESVIDLFVGEGVGDECDESDEAQVYCRSGLSCVDALCQADGDKTENDQQSGHPGSD